MVTTAFRQAVNLGNSIVGVSIPTMPFCFRKCGIILSVCIIIMSGLLNRAGCHLLFRSAILHRKRSFEVLALESLGSLGKFMVEVGILGFFTWNLCRLLCRDRWRCSRLGVSTYRCSKWSSSSSFRHYILGDVRRTPTWTSSWCWKSFLIQYIIIHPVFIPHC